jgi:transcriptional regulator with XRE-family HTH domain
MQATEAPNTAKEKRRKGRRPSGRVTMQTIAERVGVSQATVSYVLNNKPGHGSAPRSARRFCASPVS